MANLAIIPARAGSQRIPKKNIKFLGNKPLIGYTIDACLNSGIIDYIIVTSDSQDILNYAKQKGVLTHQRPENLAVEEIGTELENTRWVVLDYIKNNLQIEFEKYLFLLPTYPFRSTQDIQNAILALDQSNFLISIEKLSKNELEEHKEGKRKKIQLEGNLIRWNSFLNGARNITDKIKRYSFIEINRIQNIDIDTDLDWIQAEYIIKNDFFDFQTGEIKGGFSWRLNT